MIIERPKLVEVANPYPVGVPKPYPVRVPSPHYVSVPEPVAVPYAVPGPERTKVVKDTKYVPVTVPVAVHPTAPTLSNSWFERVGGLRHNPLLNPLPSPLPQAPERVNRWGEPMTNPASPARNRSPDALRNP